jgi:phenylacetate-CoA ligase
MGRGEWKRGMVSAGTSRALALGFDVAVKSPVVQRHIRRLDDLARRDPAELAQLQVAHAHRMSRFARRFVPAYRGRDEHRDNAVRGWPETTKGDIRQAFEAYRVPWVPARTVTTGGTGGVPALVAVSYASVLTEWAHVAYAWRGAGISLRCPKLTFRGSSLGQGFSAQQIIYQPTYNQFAVSPFHLSPRLFEELRHTIRDFNPVAIWGYPSAITPFAQWVRDVGPIPELQSIRAVLLASEGAFDWQLDLFRSVFDAAVVRWYGQSEKVAFASACTVTTNAYHVHPTYGLVELSDSRIVATGFTNLAMPLLRYDTEDCARELASSCDCGLPFPTLKGIEGRWDQMLLWGAADEPISTSSLNFHDPVFTNFERFQFRQTAAGEASLLVVPRAGLDNTHDVLAAAQSTMQRRVGDRLRITVEAVRSTDLLSALGKGIVVDQRYHPET